ncbi:protein ANTAGONIST OF LIKE HETEROCHROMATIN PROTEIN 1-like [Lucilia sericata]|uniref:protein ANTAGONIST OF LIKE HETEROCHROMATIN PROTEIN 1-like n=1 Tax=Lucilia sericata TaxID=13632 RepID=UPI0018A87868|nr:protein ANTAGONIST OF LIKE HETEROCHROMATIN PROTEIN 1-like [Lucilia sericata]
MASNTKFMMLSLLNLYLTYQEVKNGKVVPRIRSNLTRRIRAEIEQTKHKQKTSTISSTPTDITQVQNQQEQLTQVQANKPNLKRTLNNARPVRARRRTKKSKDNDNTEKKPRVRRWAIRPTNRYRVIDNYHRKVFGNIKLMSQEQFFVHTRMTKTMFDWLLSIAKSSLIKKAQRVFAQERLAITLNYLAYGTPLQSLAYKHKLGKSTIREVVLSTCTVLWNLLSPIYLCEPTTSQYADIADEFKSKWNVPNCVGAIDGKHVSHRHRIMNKDKNNIDMLIMGACDAKYKFTAVSVESFNNQSEEELLKLSPFGSALLSENLPLPASKPLFPTSASFPHYFIANTSLSLRKNIMRPYEETYLEAEKHIFNYKITTACSAIENTFGVLTARWRVLSTTIEFLQENCKTIILACIVLHNYIMTNDEDQLYCPANFVDRKEDDGTVIPGEWRNELKHNGDKPLRSMVASTRSRSSYEAKNLRDILANYIANETINYEIELLQ